MTAVLSFLYWVMIFLAVAIPVNWVIKTVQIGFIGKGRARVSSFAIVATTIDFALFMWIGTPAIILWFVGACWVLCLVLLVLEVLGLRKPRLH